MRALCLAVVLAPALSRAPSDPVEDLLAGVHEIAAPGVPGSVCAFGPEAFVVVADPAGVPVVAGARAGAGRVLAFGHGGYVGSAALAIEDTARLYRNAVRWLAGGVRNPLIVCTEPELAAALGALGLRAEDRSGLDELAEADCIVLAAGQELTRLDALELERYVRSGGGLIAAATGWGWQQLNPSRAIARDLSFNRLLVPFGLAFGLETTAKSGTAGMACDPRPDPLCHAGRALEALSAGGVAGEHEELALRRVRAALACLPDHEPAFVLPLRARLAAAPGPDAPWLERIAAEYGKRAWRPLDLRFGEWWGIGPFKHPRGSRDVEPAAAPERALKDMAAGAPGPDLARTLRGKHGDVAWLPLDVASDGRDLDVGVVRFDKLFPPPPKDPAWKRRAVAYLYRCVDAEEERELSVLLGSDDGLRLWCNGELVVDRDASLGIELEEIGAVLRLRPGANHLLAKVTNEEGVWGFRMREGGALDRVAIDECIERGIDWLLERQQVDGSWAYMPNFGPGYTSFVVYTLLKCGLGPGHPAVRRGFAYLRSRPADHTYSLSSEILALAAATRGERPAELDAAVGKLAGWQESSGLYGYPLHPDGGARPADLSCTVFAALALRAALQHEVEVDAALWNGLVEGALRCRERTGSTRGRGAPAGFAYRVGGRPTGSMTAAGLSVLLIAKDALGRRLDRRLVREVDEALEGGLAWLERNMEWTSNPGGTRFQLYYIYSIERLGSLLGRDVLGKVRWYPSGAEYLVQRQAEDGSWKSEDSTPAAAEDTPLAMLFLSRATAPRTGGERELARDLFVAEELDQEIAWRAKGTGPVDVWITGWSESARERCAWPGRGREPRIERVRYLARSAADGSERLLALVRAVPGAGAQRFEARLVLGEPGEYEILARADGLAPPAEPGLEARRVELVSGPIRFEIASPLTPAVLHYARDRDENVLLSGHARIEASSHFGNQDARSGADGQCGTRWHSALEDAQPWWRAELDSPAEVDELLFSHAWPRPMDRGKPQPARVEVTLDGEQRFEVAILADPMLKTALVLPGRRRVATVEVRIVESRDRRPGKDAVGFGEIELVRRREN